MSYENACDVICVHEDKVNNALSFLEGVLYNLNVNGFQDKAFQNKASKYFIILQIAWKQ